MNPAPIQNSQLMMRELKRDKMINNPDPPFLYVLVIADGGKSSF